MSNTYNEMQKLITTIQKQQQDEISDIAALNQLLSKKSTSSASDDNIDKSIHDLQIKINKNSSTRMLNLNKFMDIYEYIDGKYNQENIDLTSQLKTSKTIEEELNLAKENYKRLDKENYNDIRMIEINTYYEKRYRAHTKVMKKLLMLLVPLIVLAILAKKQLLPSSFVKILMFVITIIGGYFIITSIIDLSWRDNMNYDEYDWNDNLPSDNIVHSNLDNSNSNSTSNLGICIDDTCCGEGTQYDSMLGKCLPLSDFPQRAGASTSDAKSDSPLIIHTNNDSKLEGFEGFSTMEGFAKL